MAPTMRDIPPLDDEENDVTSERLSSDEVAAVHSNRRFYVNDVPSPYLSRRQAKEDVEVTRRRHMIISTVLVMLLLCAMAAGIGWYVWDTLKPVEKLAVPKYNTATIVRKEFVDSIDSASIVRPVDERPIISNISGTISEVLVEEGQFVEEEDPLYTIDNPSIIETFQKAQEALDAAQGDVDRKQEAVDKIRRSVEEAQQKKNEAAANANASSNSSTSGSTANGGTSSTNSTNGTDSNTSATNTTTDTQTQVDPSTDPRVVSAQRELDEANKTLDKIRETYDRAEEQLDNLTVRAPISGTVCDMSRNINPQTQIAGSERLCTVADLSAYLIREEIPRERFEQVHEGMEARLSFPSVNNLSSMGYVASVEENADGSECIANIVIEQPDERIVTNLACNIQLVVQAIPDALVVPREAVVHVGDTAQIDVLLDPSRGINTFVRVNELGSNATEVAVEADNIQVGTSVILSPSTEGVIQPEPEPAPEPVPAPEEQPPAKEEAPAE